MWRLLNTTLTRFWAATYISALFHKRALIYFLMCGIWKFSVWFLLDVQDLNSDDLQIPLQLRTFLNLSCWKRFSTTLEFIIDRCFQKLLWISFDHRIMHNDFWKAAETIKYKLIDYTVMFSIKGLWICTFWWIQQVYCGTFWQRWCIFDTVSVTTRVYSEISDDEPTS